MQPKSSMRRRLAVITALMIITSAVGFMLGQYAPPPSGRDPAPPRSVEAYAPRAESLIERLSQCGSAHGSGNVMETKQAMARLSSLLCSEDALTRNRAMHAFIARLAPDDFADAATRFRGLGLIDTRPLEYSLLISAWAKVNPQAAMDYLMSNGGVMSARNTVLATWSALDPDAAIQWAEANHEGDANNPYLIGIIQGLVASDRERATQLLADTRGVVLEQALEAMLPQILSHGKDATRAWISGISAETVRQEAIKLAAQRFALADPAGTVDWLSTFPASHIDPPTPAHE